MRSFAIALEPAPSPRLAFVAALVHALAAAAPWIAHVPPLVGIPLTLSALAALALTLARLPGRHCSLAGLWLDGGGCRARLLGSSACIPVELGARSRAYADLVVLEVRAGRRRLGWLLPRGSVPPADFRRLKARIRLTC
jgi:hypothetical protein